MVRPEVGQSVFSRLAREFAGQTADFGIGDVDKKWLWISAALNALSLSVQRSLLESLSEPRDLGFTTAYAIGMSLCDRKLPIEDVVGSADEDFSLIVESIARFGEPSSLPDNLRDEILSRSRQFAEAVVSELSSSPDLFAAETLGLAPLGASAAGLATLQEEAGAAKRRMVHVTGPDVFSLLQALLDPETRFTSDQLTATAAAMGQWRLWKPFGRLLVARALGPYRQERAFLEENLADIAKGSFSQAAEEGMARILSNKPLAQRPLPPRADYCDHVVAAYETLAKGIKSKDPNIVLPAIVRIHCIDPALISFLDWNKIVAIARKQYFITPQAAFVTMLAGSEAVRSLYPVDSTGMGLGALTADVMALYAESRRNQQLPTLLRQIGTLPAPAAIALCEAVLDRAVLERIEADLLPPKNWPKDLRAGASRLSTLRIEALKLALGRGLLAEDYVDTQVEHERGLIRMHYFQNRMLAGRVRIPSEEIRAAVRDVTEDFISTDLLRSAARSDSNSPHFVPRLASYIAGQIADRILFDSTASVDQALSANLRHGIVLSRFVRAFDDAFRIVERRTTDWKEDELRKVFGLTSDRILGFRSGVMSTVKAFIQQTLTVNRDGDLDKSFRREVADAIEDYVLSAGPSDSLERAVEEGALRAIKHALANSSALLATDVKAMLMVELMQVRKYTGERVNRELTRFVDCLESKLVDAFNDVQKWIAVAEDDGVPISFGLHEVVNIELLTHHLSAWRNLKVTTTCRRLAGDQYEEAEFAIHGRYLNLFQDIINNLLSNAFKHSGEALKTEIEIRLDVAPQELMLRCVNSLSAASAEDVQKRYRRTVGLARHSVGKEVSQDSVSGFQKMRLAVQRGLGRDAIFNIPPVSQKRSRFVIEISVREPPEIIDEEA